jgi:hypothetical protein
MRNIKKHAADHHFGDRKRGLAKAVKKFKRKKNSISTLTKRPKP